MGGPEIRILSEHLKEERDYWLRKLVGEPAYAGLPADFARPAGGRRAGRFSFDIEGDTYDRLLKASNGSEPLVFTALVALLKVCLHRYTGVEDVIVGTAISARRGEDARLNRMLALRDNVRAGATLRELLPQVKRTLSEAYSNQKYPFERLLELLRVAAADGRSPLFQWAVLFDGVSDLKSFETAACDAALTFSARGPALAASIDYDAGVFRAETIERFAAHYRRALRAALEAPDMPFHTLDMLSAEEEELLLVGFNRSAGDYPRDKSVGELFEEQAARAPDATALAWDGGQFTYRELNESANRLARHLRAAGVGPEMPVGILLERSPELVVSVLAVLKAGGAYVPLDPSYPRDRLCLILDDSGARTLIARGRGDAPLPEYGGRVIAIDEEREAIERLDASDLAPLATPGSLAYVIYTSGSTGKPKGVCVEHRAVVRLVRETNYVRLGPDETFLLLAPATFDASTFELWGSLLNGARLALMPADAPTLEELGRALRRHGVSVLWLTAGLFHLMVDRQLDALKSVGQVLAGGDVLSVPHVRKFLAESPGCTLINGYGPTEGTTFTCCHPMTRGDELHVSVPIGRPIANTQVYLLDGRMRPVPQGAFGDLYAGGDGLARGYLNRPALTAERFVPDPFSRRPGARLYRTGDRARYLPDGTIEFGGRLDHQVKVRGFRIEPGEIEAALASHPSVADSVVVAREDEPGDKRLVAYFVGRGAQPPPASELRAFLKERLPEYMMPQAFVSLEALPLTPNGKLDRKALPPPDAPTAGGSYVAPRTEAEKLLAGLWAQALGVERVGLSDDFFEMGGHSLLATRLVNRVKEVFNVEIPLRSVFETPTVAGMAEAITAASADDRSSETPPIERAPEGEPAPLSSAQRRLWFIDQLMPGDPAYNVYAAFDLEGDLDRTALERGLAELVRRHDILRTTFPAVGGEPVAVVSNEPSFSLAFEDLSGADADAREAAADAIILGEAVRPFDLCGGPLFRALLLRLSPSRHALLLTLHHIATDGWSLTLLARELSALYAAYRSGLRPALPDPPLRYSDFARWQRRAADSPALERQLSYWRERLAGAPTELGLPADRSRPASPSSRGAAIRWRLGGEAWRRLRALCRSEGVTPFMALLSAYALLLGRYAGRGDLLIGVPTAGRVRPELERVAGLFANTLVVRVEAGGAESFSALLAGVRESALGAYANQGVPFERIVEELQPERGLSSHPLFQVAFALHSEPLNPFEFEGLTVIAKQVEHKTSKFDLMFSFTETGDGLSAFVEYNTDIFEAATVERMVAHFRNILSAACEDPRRPVAELPLMAEGEVRQIVEGWNDTASDYPRDRCVHELFREQAARTPDAVAVSDGDERMTYRELDALSDRFAGHLRSRGVRDEELVAVCMSRSARMVVALLGILKAGAAYVPLDLSYPEERLAFMLEDAGARLLVAERATAGKLAGVVACVLMDEWQGRVESPADAEVRSGVGAENLAYVVYTSGSTGRPKGICVTHRAINRLVINSDYVSLCAKDRVAQASNSSFDAATFEIWGALLNGARLVIIGKEDAIEPDRLSARLRGEQVNTIFLTTALFNQVAREDAAAFAQLKYVLFGGEAVDPRWVREVLARGGPQHLLHVYGPTESTTFATWFEVVRVAEDATTVPIGRPIRNTETFILDEGMRPVPVGVPGELYLGGDGLARGYLNRPALTAERFVPDPFSRRPGARLYRTGDRARYLSGGEIEFIGRLDHQVKVRGFRVELGEIEAALAQHPDVGEAAVVVRARPDGEKRIIAYLVGVRKDAALGGELRRCLKERLPEYMIPSAYVFLEALPLTPNGKLDRAALPEPDSERADVGPYAEARTGIEEMLAEIWARTLGVQRVGLHDNFFDLGGHSLLATRLVSQVKKAFDTNIALRSLFENPTVAELSEVIADAVRGGPAADAADRPRIERVPTEGPLPLSSEQRRLWFLERLSPGSPTYNVPLAYSLLGRLDAPALLSALREIVRRHETLRTRFEERTGEPTQVICGPEVFKPEVVDLSALPEAEREARADEAVREEAVRPFDLSRGPVIRALLLRLSPESHALVLTAHHIATDGWSVGVMLRELATLYEAYKRGEDSPLEDPPVRYADFAAWQKRLLSGEALEGQLRYWRGQLEGASSALELPTDFVRPPVQTFAGATLRFGLGGETSRALRELCGREGVTMFMALLSAYAVLLGRYSRQDEVLIGTPVANRADAELEQVVGFFANTLVLRARLAGDPTFRELLGRVRETCIGAYAHQDVPFERIVEELRVERDLSRSPLFQAMLVYHAGGDQMIELPGLTLTQMTLDPPVAKFDLSLAVTDTGGELSASFNYSTALFSEETVTRMASHFVTLLESAAAEGSRIAELPLMAEGEVRQIVEGWNDTASDYPSGLRLHEMFERRASATPEAVALFCEERALSYSQLNERANRLARRLRRLGVGPDALVAVCAERSPEMVVALLGILKAGGAYVPLDPTYPKERLAFMLEDARPAVLLTQSRLADRLPRHGARTLLLDSDWDEAAAERGADFDAGVGETNLAYMIYTSGSTGRPKGAMNTHRGICNRLLWMQAAYGLGPTDRVLQKTSFSFDVSVWEFFWPLVTGARLVLAKPDGHKDPDYLSRLINEQGVTTLHFVPSMLKVFIESGALARCAGLRRVICSGEALSPELRRRFFEVSGAELHNLYGPTEASVDVTSWECGRAEDDSRPVPIGRPIANTQIYLLDGRQQIVPLGVPGELYIGGRGLARGYWNRPGLTAEKFIPDPFSKEPGARLYRTGDLARYLPGGEIEFVGRLDHQVKVRGFRVELGEIEAALAQHPRVSEATAVVRDDARGDRRIVAYFVARGGAGADAADLRAHLRERLPEHMVPAAFVRLDALPLTPNGKLDRKALPPPGEEHPAALSSPRTEAERAIAAVWKDVLGLDSVGVADNFFDLGGHSLLLVQAHARLREIFRQDFSVIDLFKYPTVGSLAGFLSDASPAAAAARGEVPGQRRAADTAVAIVGMAGRFPGARDLEEFWENLRGGVESVSFFSREELAEDGVEPPLLDDPNYVAAAAVLEGADEFDAQFFGMTPREAEITDPQQRLFLECAWQAVESAGYDAARYAGRVGVFAGVSMSTYLQHVVSDAELLRSAGAFSVLIGNDKDHLPTRVSYKLNLRGPSVNVQTACSTSLVAVHLACRSLLDGECDMALAGGASVRASQRSGYLYQEGGIHSPDGHCRAFDARAAGTLPGNGVGVVLLKRLRDALADGDTVHAVILGSAVNNDGSQKVGYTAPSVEGQAEVVAAAQRAAGVGAETITYVEAHGTGTPLGDPVEVVALTQAFRAQTEKTGYCAVGSLKTNVGHMDAAAGVAGLIKTVLALKHKAIPPSLHFREPNPRIDFAASPFFVNDGLRRWEALDTPRRAGVSSFGIGGTNAHVVLEEAPEPALAADASRGPQLLLLSARSAAALDAMTANLAARLERDPAADIADVAYTLQTGRREFTYRRAVVVRGASDASVALNTPSRVRTAAPPQGEPAVFFMYPGQGAQYAGMGAELYKSHGVFREEVDACAQSLRAHAGYDLRDILFGRAGGDAGAGEPLEQTLYAQPALFVIEYALTRLWMELGVRPRGLVGHSVGELVAACVAGVFSREDALALVAARGRLMQAMPPGSMLAVPLPEGEVERLVGGRLSIASVNGPALCVVAGPSEDVDALSARLASGGLECRRLHTSHAFHSRMMEPAVRPFVELVRGVRLSAPRIPFLSDVTGTWATPVQATDPDYWGEHMLKAVRFGDCLRELLKEPRTVLLEVGPGRILSGLARAHPSRAAGHAAVSSLGHAKDGQTDSAPLLGAAAEFWLAGARLDFARLHEGRQRRRVLLPTYPFERQSYRVSRPTKGRHAEADRAGADAQTDARVLPFKAAQHSGQPRPTPEEAAAGGQARLDDLTAMHRPDVRDGADAAVKQIITQQLEVMAGQLELLRRRKPAAEQTQATKAG
jgi:amino acid adenylation domain-containing protein